MLYVKRDSSLFQSQGAGINGSIFIVLSFIDVNAKNKPLDKMEVIVYRRKAITILWTLVLIELILLFLDLHIYFASIVVAIIQLSIMLILGKYLTAE